MLKGIILGVGALFFAAMPSTGNYQLKDFGFGSGGGESSSSNYQIQGIAGELSFDESGSNNYGLVPGLVGSQLAALPGAPSWQNPGDWYNRLQLIIDTAGNPADTTYAVAISDDGFATTRYVQDDSTIGDSLGPEDFRDYTGWGDSSGVSVIGLKPDTTYQVRVKARQGDFSETSFGPSASASTAQVAISFDIDIAATDTETSPPYSLELGSILPDTVIDSPELIWLDLESNAEHGASVYIVSNNQGLLSSSSGYVIDAVTGDLGSLDEGIGAQNSSATASSGGPFSPAPPFDGSSFVVGSIESQFKQLISSATAISGGRASFLLKIKTSGSTPAAPDYSDLFTLVATAAF